jgi:hypothetical protein
MPPPNAILPETYGIVYQVQGAYDFTAGSSFFLSSFPMPLAKENHLIANKLGRHGFERIQQFRDYLPGWDFGYGQPMSELGLGRLCVFLDHVKLPEGKRPSVFLNPTGTLELAWEDLEGRKMQAEFGPTNIEYYREDTGIEGQLPAKDAVQAAELLAS